MVDLTNGQYEYSGGGSGGSILIRTGNFSGKKSILLTKKLTKLKESEEGNVVTNALTTIIFQEQLYSWLGAKYSVHAVGETEIGDSKLTWVC